MSLFCANFLLPPPLLPPPSLEDVPYGLFVRGRTVQYYSSEAFFRGKGMKIADVLLMCFPRQITCKNREALLNEEVKRRRRVR